MYYQRNINVGKTSMVGKEFNVSLKKKNVAACSPTTILWRPLLRFAHAGGGLACAHGSVLLVSRCGVSCWLLLVVKHVLGDHVHLLAFQSTWITVRRREGLQNTETELLELLSVTLCLKVVCICLWLKIPHVFSQVPIKMDSLTMLLPKIKSISISKLKFKGYYYLLTEKIDIKMIPKHCAPLYKSCCYFYLSSKSFDMIWVTYQQNQWAALHHLWLLLKSYC